MNHDSHAGYRQLRRGRRSLAGQHYLLTTTTASRERLFLDRQLADIVRALSAEPQTWTPCRCLGWVLMPDHWHGLIELGENTTLATVMRRFKGVTARTVNQACSRCGSMWAKGFHDRALRHDESIAATLRYIIANPVRAGLASHPSDYPYWDSIYPEDLAWPKYFGGNRD